MKDNRNRKYCQNFSDSMFDLWMKISYLSIEIDVKGFKKGHEFSGKCGCSVGLRNVDTFVLKLGFSFLIFINGQQFFKEDIVVVKQ